MTNKELNRDIKRLWNEYNRYYGGDVSKWSQEIWNNYEKWEKKQKQELNRLWNADSEKTATSHKNLMRLIRMNQTWRVITLHHIATHWKLD